MHSEATAAASGNRSSNADWQSRKEQAIARGESNLHPIYVALAKNAEIWDVEGKQYIDFGAGIAVCNTGHGHPRIVGAAKQQLDDFSHTCVMVTPYDSAVRLAERLNVITPGDTPKKTMFVTTGAEAVENAVKIGRAHTGRRAVIAFNGGYHGRTNFTLGLTGKNAPYKTLFGPFPADIYRTAYPIPYHGVSEDDALEALNLVLTCDIAPEDVAAIILEPVQGEGGFYPASDSFMRALRSLCDTHGIVMIADEIQTGFARTGRMFCTEYSGVEPDLITMAKGMAGGLPIAAVTGKAEIMDAPLAGGLGGTYAGSPVGCAAALAVMDVIEEEKLMQAAINIGEIFKQRLGELQREYPDLIGDVRADRGAMIAIELVHDGDASRPNPELLGKLVTNALANGLITLKCGIRNNVLRFIPPLTIGKDIVHDGLDRLEESFQNSLQ